ncbi:MAG: hypothetical protein KTR31_21495 [Myxococcales bacterium]|nr:hypothetical protein [Myxococcales bacterium]
MARFLKTLAKMGLVELSDEEQAAMEARGDAPTSSDDIEKLLAETRAMTGQLDPGADEPEVSEPEAAETPDTPPPLPVEPAAPAPVDGLPEGQPFDELYAAAEVPESPYPAEQLLKLLEGLAAMEPAVRKAAVIAMDNADETWTVGDSLLDAERKVGVLQRKLASLDQVVQATEAQAAEQLADAEARAADAKEKVHAQIAELEALLAEEMMAVATEKARIEAHRAQTKAARDREGSRLHDEMERLRSLYPMFGNTDPEQ